MERAAADNRADKELEGVRDEFIQRVSDAMINQLLDLCLKDHLLNYEEKDSILEENRTRANKARALIDAVIKKGAETCEKMIGYLERKDQNLFKLLGLSSTQSSQTADKRRREEEGEEETACKKARHEDKLDGVNQSQDLSEMQLLQVAEQLGMEWKQVAIYLGLETKDVDDLEESEKSVTMRKQKMLLKWKRKKKPGQATAKHLLESLKKMNNLSHKVYEILEAAAGPVDQSGSTPSVSSVEEFWKSKENDPEVYPVTQTSFRNRVALLITNIKFSEKSMNRRGAEKDEENMEKLLSNLGYEVVKYTNLTGKAIDEALIDFTKHPKLKHTDSVFVVLMSHGKLRKILGADWKKDQPDEFPINNIFKHLGSKSCPELRDKPKVIIIQACRGEQGGSVLVNDGPNTADHVLQSEDLEADKLQFVHIEKNFISLLSCTPDTVSYRQPDYGSLLIQYIVKVFTPESYKKHIYELFRKVQRHVEEFKSREKLQMPTIDRCTLTKKFYLFQGLLHNNH